MKSVLFLLFYGFFVACNNETSVDLKREYLRVDSLAAAQNSTPYDSLMKYSYPIRFMKNGEFTGGGATGFFIKLQRNPDSIYFFSNYHAFTNKNTFAKERLDTLGYDSIAVPYSVAAENPKYVFIDVRKIQRDSPYRNSFNNNEPDVYGCKIPFPKDEPIYSLEKFPHEILKEQEPDKVIIYGFPEDTRLPELLLSHLLTKINDTLDISTKEGKRYHLYNCFFTLPSSTSGYSGAPVFLHYKDGSIAFGGILSSHLGLSTGMATQSFKSSEVYRLVK